MPVTAEWIRSHPEKRMETRTFERDEWGIFIADKVAGSPEPPAEFLNDHTHVTIEFLDMFPDLLSYPTWIWFHDGHPILHSLKDISDRRRLSSYLTSRDHYRLRADPPRPPIWATSSTALAGAIWTSRKQSLKERSIACRRTYDWNFHGSNRAKSTTLSTQDRELTLACPLCASPEHNFHAFSACIHSALVAKRTQLHTEIQNHIHEARTPLSDSGQSLLTRYWEGCLGSDAKHYISGQLTPTQVDGLLHGLVAYTDDHHKIRQAFTSLARRVAEAARTAHTEHFTVLKSYENDKGNDNDNTTEDDIVPLPPPWQAPEDRPPPTKRKRLTKGASSSARMVRMRPLTHYFHSQQTDTTQSQLTELTNTPTDSTNSPQVHISSPEHSPMSLTAHQWEPP